MPRITGGTAKNKRLLVPNIERIRVVQDVLKLALFSILGNKVTNAACLDLYAGSGSLGLEALSRGARSCEFVDESRKAAETLAKNIANCGFGDKATVRQHDVVKFTANTDLKFDVIFADPFYEDVKHRFLLQSMAEILAPNGVIAFLHGDNLDLASQLDGTGLNVHTTRRFGKSYLSILLLGDTQS